MPPLGSKTKIPSLTDTIFFHGKKSQFIFINKNWKLPYSATLPKCDKQQNRVQANLNPDLEELCVLQYPNYEPH